MMTKAHIFICDIPLREGLSYEVLCSRTIKDAHFAFMWDGDLMPGTLPDKLDVSMRFCRKCFHACLENQESRRYVYGLVQGEE